MFTTWILLVTVMAVALASPGPDFVMCVRNSIRYSRRSGIMTALGLAIGVGVHVSYCLAGLAILISKSILLFNSLKFIGAAYLFYVGYHALKSKGFAVGNGVEEEETKEFSNWQAFRSGFITNLFNPKATMFFLALFTQIINPNAELWVQIIYGTTCVLMTAGWFSIVSTVLTTEKIRARFISLSKWIDRLCGGIFIALGIKLAASKI